MEKINVFQIGNGVLEKNSNGKKSIYKRELFVDCKTDAQKKAMRIKLRREMNKYLATFLSNEKNQSKLVELKKAWQVYAKNVYDNVNIICDANTNDDTAKLCQRFLQTLAKVEVK